MPDYHLAQVNIATMRAGLDSPMMQDFVNQLDEINALADVAPGFVWRLQNDDGNATSIQVFDDMSILTNMSVWESIEALYQYTYQSLHVEVFRRRKDWFYFQKSDKPHLTMWWIPAGHIPTVEEAKAKLEYLEEHGPTPLAFTFKQRFSLEEMLALQED